MTENEQKQENHEVSEPDDENINISGTLATLIKHKKQIVFVCIVLLLLYFSFVTYQYGMYKICEDSGGKLGQWEGDNKIVCVKQNCNPDDCKALYSTSNINLNEVIEIG